MRTTQAALCALFVAIAVVTGCAVRRHGKSAHASFMEEGKGTTADDDDRIFDLGCSGKCRYWEHTRFVVVADPKDARLYSCETYRRQRYVEGHTGRVVVPGSGTYDYSIREYTTKSGTHGTLRRGFGCGKVAEGEHYFWRAAQAAALTRILAATTEELVPSDVVAQFRAQAQAEIDAVSKSFEHAKKCCMEGCALEGSRMGFCLLAADYLAGKPISGGVIAPDPAGALQFYLEACKGDPSDHLTSIERKQSQTAMGCFAAANMLVTTEPERACTLTTEACRLAPKSVVDNYCRWRDERCPAQ